MVLNVLDRPGDGCAALRHLLTDNDEPRPAQRRHIRRAIAIYRSLSSTGVIERLDTPDDQGRQVRVTVDLQADFALNQPLSPFVLEALPHLDTDSPDFALDVLSIVESTLDNPGPVLAAQLDRLKTEVINRLKTEGVEYEERMEILEKLEYPKPLRDFTYDLFDQYRMVHPWVGDHNIAPKSVARDLSEQSMGFAEYVAHYKVTRSEGLLLRYLGDAYKGLVQNVPEHLKTDELLDLTEWLGELVRQVDSSLLDEWDRLKHPDELAAAAAGAVDIDAAELARLAAPPPVTANRRAFTVMVRNEAFRRITLAGNRRWNELGDLDAEAGWNAERWRSAFEPYLDEHDLIGIDQDARAGAYFQVTEEPEVWHVRQVIDDPAGDHEWAILLDVDLPASDELGAPVVVPTAVARL